MSDKMTIASSNHANAARGATRLFTTRTFRAILENRTNAEINQDMRNLRSHLGLRPYSTNEELVHTAYKFLSLHYRNEYVYKNLLASKIFVGRHRAANSTLINEFKIGSAIADTAFFNGKATAYEIKTELDSPAKLTRQLLQYFNAFTTVYVVAHDSVASSYRDQIDGSPAGLISVGKRWQLSVIKPATEHTRDLETEAMFNTLRMGEVDATLRHLGQEPHRGPNGLRYGHNLDLAKEIPVTEFHRAWSCTIKDRKHHHATTLLRNPRIFPLRSLMAQIDPPADQATHLLHWLSKGSL